MSDPMRAMAQVLTHVPHPCFRGDPCVACGARADRAIHDFDFAERHNVFWPAALRPARKEHPIEHGTITGYSGRGCRCPDCRAAMAAYQRERRARSSLGAPQRQGRKHA